MYFKLQNADIHFPGAFVLTLYHFLGQTKGDALVPQGPEVARADQQSRRQDSTSQIRKGIGLFLVLKTILTDFLIRICELFPICLIIHFPFYLFFEISIAMTFFLIKV